MVQPQVPAAIPTASAALPGVHRRQSALAIVSMIVLGLGTLVVAVLVFLGGGPIGALITTLLAAVSFPLLIWLCFWLDRYEPEPARYRLAALAWGGTIAVGIGLAIEIAIPAPEDIGTVVVAPFAEELSKGLFVVAIVVLRRRQVHGVLDGVVYGALVGIGFAFTEDILYYQGALKENALISTFIGRGILGPFGHPLYTACTGLGIGYAVMTKSRVMRVVAPIAGFVGAMLLHGIWNGVATWAQDSFLIVYAVFWLPLLIVAILLGAWIRRREGRMLGSALAQCAAYGLIQPSEVHWVATLKDRRAARQYAKRVGGKQAARVVTDYQQTLTEMGFLHDRVVKGTAPPDYPSRMAALQQHLAEIRPYLALPPTPPPGYGPSYGNPPGPVAGPSGYSPIPGGPQ